MIKSATAAILAVFAAGLLAYGHAFDQQYVKHYALITVHQTGRTLGFSPEDMESLLYPPGGIPGYLAVPRYNSSNGKTYHTTIYLDGLHGGSQPSMGSSIIRSWGPADGRKRGVSADVALCETPDGARRRLDSFGQLTSTPLAYRSYSGQIIGVGSWSNPQFGGMIAFAVGRMFVVVHVSDAELSRAERDTSAEAVALSLEYAYRGRPDLLLGVDLPKRPEVLVKGEHGRTEMPVLTYNGLTWAPLELFKAAGASASYDFAKNVAKLAYGGHRLTLKPFDRSATANGKELDLPAPVLLWQGQPIVPLRAVAEALGFAVAAEEGRITLTPPR
ncbi:MAG: copper amine oxidase N-terminal domain-containing protein [Armatimonadetes bacterium]|nr:copper amine oxidase N-terminal domain-containing protein [Armatimonadota bacterium]